MTLQTHLKQQSELLLLFIFFIYLRNSTFSYNILQETQNTRHLYFIQYFINFSLEIDRQTTNVLSVSYIN